MGARLHTICTTEPVLLEHLIAPTRHRSPARDLIRTRLPAAVTVAADLHEIKKQMTDPCSLWR